MQGPNRPIIVALARCRGLMSKSAFARRLGVNRQTVQHWFDGTRRPDVRSYQRLLDLFPECRDDLIAAFAQREEGAPC